jgi:DNA-binding GntR family transcriptional regulator
MNDSEWIGVMLATTRFYELIFDEAGHTVAWDIVQRLNGRISRLRVLTLSAKNRPSPGMNHMVAISDAILSRDADAAKDAVQAHIADAYEIARQFLSDDTESAANHG